MSQTFRRRSGKLLLFFLSLFLFVWAILMMKDGAKALTPFVRQKMAIDNPFNSLGFGWLFAYLIMSGSPVAATALTFMDAGVLDGLGTFTMISGSRLGASFIVLFVGFIYVLRGRDRATSLSMGLLALLVTATLQLLTLGFGLVALPAGWFDGWYVPGGSGVTAVTAVLFDPLLIMASTYLPEWALFLVGMGIMMTSFNLFDRCLPEMTLRESEFGRMSRVVYRPIVMFLLGAALTLISMSVSVSLSILVPLSNRGFVRRENVIPYIMGANVTTFIDTLLAATLMQNPQVVAVVLTQMAGVAAASLMIQFLLLRPYERAVLQAVAWITADNRHLLLFLAFILILPVLLLLW
ncbi:MAG: hypothetical protein Kow0080_08500 [Candidatus Promineifilaceae bacterium]